uniref:Uncharacterized protein LOC111102957 n=1 Tax=Crassostrea virginica TaxID=6565 RepID=A0A8B8AKB3_CRAVI|nr:uncharacterized protein LOC111102957 [Crassostrea virginica]
MGNIDSLPVISQIKSLYQVMTGDIEGARQTQKNFAETGIIASQITSLIHSANGDNEAARKTQIKFAKGIESLVDSIPYFGHIKGGIHYALGQKEKGDAVMKSASGTVLTAAAGAAGFIAGGPAGGAAAAVAASHAYDGIVTGIDTAVNGPREDGRPRFHGYWDTYDKIGRGEGSSGEIFDLAAGIGFDAIGGKSVKVVGKGIKGVVKTVGKEIGESIPGSKLATNIAKKTVRCKRDAGYFLSPEESNFVRNHLTLEDGMSKMTNANWKNMTMTDTLSNMVSLFVILKLVLWNDKNGRHYSRELCSFSETTEENIHTCQLAILNNIRRLDNRMNGCNETELLHLILHPDVPIKINNSSEILVKTVTSLYGILSSIGMRKRIGVIWTDEICLFKEKQAYKLCEHDVLESLSTTHIKAFHLGQKRKRRAACRPEKKTVGTYNALKKKKNKISGYEANHVPASSAFIKFFEETNKNINAKSVVKNLPAHQIPKILHQDLMTKVGTSKNSNIAKTLRHYQKEALKANRLDLALKLDFVASYGRANAAPNIRSEFRPALEKYRPDLIKLVDKWSKKVDEVKAGKNPDFAAFIGEPDLTKHRLQGLKNFIDYESNRFRGGEISRDRWISHMENIYQNIIDENNLRPLEKGPKVYLKKDEYKYGK